MEHYRESVDFVNANVDQAAALVGSYDIVPEAVAKKALPGCNIVFFERLRHERQAVRLPERAVPAKSPVGWRLASR